MGIRASGIYATLVRVRPALFAVRNFLEKALTISRVDRFTRRGGNCRLHAIFMNQLCIIWGYQEELSSTAARDIPTAAQTRIISGGEFLSRTGGSYRDISWLAHGFLGSSLPTPATQWRLCRQTGSARCEQRIASRLGNHSAQIELIAIKAKHKVPNGR
jgi:hypothetical protein